MGASEQWRKRTKRIRYFEASLLGGFLGYRDTVFRCMVGCLGVRHGTGELLLYGGDELDEPVFLRVKLGG
jgi:hypothetical protein